jgi:hypothetical protein
VIPNNPAGRLKALFEVFHANDGSRSLTDWWQVVAAQVADNGDPYSVRAEAGALFRDVEQAARALPAEDDPSALLAEREVWARPIFGWSLLDAANQPIRAEGLISRRSINALNGLAGVLRRDAAEFKILADPVAVAEELERLRVQLSELLLAVSNDRDLPDESRRFIAHALVRAIDDITYVQLRGLASLHHDVRTAHIESVSAADAPVVRDDPERLKRVRRWGDALLEVVTTIEKIVVPTATTVAVALASGGDLPSALAAGTASRLALGVRPSGAQRQLPAGGSEDDDQAENIG